MKKICLILALAFTSLTILHAQYVTIPDTAFVRWLENNGFDSCMVGNQLDTTCDAVLSDSSMYCTFSSIRDLMGIQYFKGLTSLYCAYDLIDDIPALPPNLFSFDCDNNQLTNLPALPSPLRILWCNNNQLIDLPALPPSLGSLYCENNQITSVPALPDSLETLVCYTNRLTNLPQLPVGLEFLDCGYNQLTDLGPLPAPLQILRCHYNRLTSMPGLPVTIQDLECDNNQLSTLPPLPYLLQDLWCFNNQLTSLPALPPGLTTLECEGNQLTTIPELPDTLNVLDCRANLNLACLPELKTIISLFFDGTAIKCVPDYGNVTSSIPPVNTFPLCSNFNPNDCVPTSINTINTGEIYLALFPNPAKDYTMVQVSDNIIGSRLELEDETGRLISKQPVTNREICLSTGSLAHGVYFVKVVSVMGGEAVKKLVVAE